MSLQKTKNMKCGVFMNNMYEPYPDRPEDEKDCKKECKKDVKHYVDINVPVDITPKAEIGRIEAECCSAPEVVCADGGKPDECHLIIVQRVCIKIPVKYAFSYKVGKSMTECCKGCD